MEPLMKMLVSLISIMTMFMANLFIIFARKKLTGVFKWTVSIGAYFLLFISFIFIVAVIFNI